MLLLMAKAKGCVLPLQAHSGLSHDVLVNLMPTIPFHSDLAGTLPCRATPGLTCLSPFARPDTYLPVLCRLYTYATPLKSHLGLDGLVSLPGEDHQQSNACLQHIVAEP